MSTDAEQYPFDYKLITIERGDDVIRVFLSPDVQSREQRIVSTLEYCVKDTRFSWPDAIYVLSTDEYDPDTTRDPHVKIDLQTGDVTSIQDLLAIPPSMELVIQSSERSKMLTPPWIALMAMRTGYRLWSLGGIPMRFDHNMKLASHVATRLAAFNHAGELAELTINQRVSGINSSFMTGFFNSWGDGFNASKAVIRAARRRAFIGAVFVAGLLPLAFASAHAWARPIWRPRHVGALHGRANVERMLGRRKRLEKTKARMRALGEGERALAEYEVWDPDYKSFNLNPAHCPLDGAPVVFDEDEHEKDILI